MSYKVTYGKSVHNHLEISAVVKTLKQSIDLSIFDDIGCDPVNPRPDLAAGLEGFRKSPHFKEDLLVEL